jgi:hypothetical protein
MLGTVGFRRVEMVSQEFRFSHPSRLARAVKRKLLNNESFWLNLSQDRMVFHARR